ncbi:MAG TPA: LON peptidase substrate-binding domain-containing protein [Terriglobales bacterium]|nr:LON peptidase substrate-binding domain-containing protein [Terriglobales bacterium]
MKQLLPLFPLDVVLFPGTPLPLHIFEPRYKELVSECLEDKTRFGIVRAKAPQEEGEEAGVEEGREADGNQQEHALADVGCTAEIVAVTKTYPDGRMDIVTEGRERFEVLDIDEERSFLRGEVVYFDDEPGTAGDEEIARAVKLHSEILAIAGAKQSLPEELKQVSFHLAGSLPLDLDFKQALLEMRSESKRIEAVITAFEAILPKLRRTVQLRQRAGGNGHAGGSGSH